ncbi:MAG: hypothetical protein ACI8SK_000549 [Shewanella sp.]|jgi:hypothetical protein
MCLRRLAEVSAHPPLEAIDNNEGVTFNSPAQYQLN